MTARPIALVAMVALVTLRAVPGSAQPAGDPSRAQAAAHTRQGLAYFERADYDRAIAEYQAAFDLSAEPSLIFNIALCFDRTSRPEQALAAFQRYLALAPGGAVADEARNDVARLTPVVEKLRADRAAEDARRRDAAAARAAAERAAAEREDRAAARRGRIARYVLTASAVVTAAGATAHVLSWRTREQLTGAPDAETYFNHRPGFEVERDVAIAAYAVGGATLATGLILAYSARGRGDRPQLAATIVPGGAALVVAWSR